MFTCTPTWNANMSRHTLHCGNIGCALVSVYSCGMRPLRKICTKICLLQKLVDGYSNQMGHTSLIGRTKECKERFNQRSTILYLGFACKTGYRTKRCKKKGAHCSQDASAKGVPMCLCLDYHNCLVMKKPMTSWALVLHDLFRRREWVDRRDCHWREVWYRSNNNGGNTFWPSRYTVIYRVQGFQRNIQPQNGASISWVTLP